MAIDLSKLTPEPWEYTHGSEPIGDTGDYDPWVNVESAARVICRFDETVNDKEGDWHTDAEFFVLARAAFGVMMRRGWQPRRDYYATDESRWFVVDEFGNLVCHILRSDQPFTAADPFTCLVEADRWYAENVEART